MSSRKTIIHFVRHGEVENPDGIRYGRLPGYHLSAKGRTSVAALAPFFRERQIAHIYSSPLERTQQTATLLGTALPDVPITLETRLLETKTLPQFEGKSRNLGFYIPTKKESGAETKQDIVRRMHQFVEDMSIKYHGQEIIAVGHGDPIDLLYNNYVYTLVENRPNNYPRYASTLSFVLTGSQVKEVWFFNPNS